MNNNEKTWEKDNRGINFNWIDHRYSETKLEMMLSADGGIPIMFNNRNYSEFTLCLFSCCFNFTITQFPLRFWTNKWPKTKLLSGIKGSLRGVHGRCFWNMKKETHYYKAVKCVGPQAYCSSQGQWGSVIKPALLAPPKEPAKPLRPSLCPSIIINISARCTWTSPRLNWVTAVRGGRTS